MATDPPSSEKPEHTAPLARRLPPLGQDDPDLILDCFLDYVAELGLELYPAQEEALLEIMAGKNVILSTPTGSGKSLVALAMHFKAMVEDRRSFYTTPIKALANEKFFALCEAFGPQYVGLLTGDAAVNRDAPILCCTAEVLANMALREGAQAKVDYAILDEFHYYDDPDRGVAWQIPLLTLPNTTFLLMSATLGDVTFFEGALTDLNGWPTATVTSSERPVPLDFSYFEMPLHATISRLIETDMAPVYLVNFSQNSCHVEAQNLMSVNVATKDTKRALAAALKDFRFDTPYGRDLQRFLRHGVGIHHGGMLPKYRRLTERLAQQGLLKVISGTDTLGVGVNIPIRTVLLTKLCKFDGGKTRILNVREFLQICGRAGRKGFDDRGGVVVQAPEHVIENLQLEAKAKADPSKKKKIVKRKPPTKGYVRWDKGTFERLRTGKPEPLESRFAVSHAMLLNVLGRPEGGCQAMKRLVRSCHDRKAVRLRHGELAMQMLRSLVEANIITFVPREDGRRGKRLRVNIELQRDFSLYHSLSLYAVETIGRLEPQLESYPLDVLSLVEAILENPTLILKKQIHRLKGELVAELKAAGVEYDDRMEELEKVEHPKPNADFIYETFNAFAAKHPWVGEENIRPKGVARELYEGYFGFQEYIQSYKLERAEGMVLRYLTDVYKALVQMVPEWARTDELDDLIAYFHGVVRGVDSSLLDEWERLRDPDYVPAPAQEPEELLPRGITADVRAFTVTVRNHVYQLVRALAGKQYAAALELLDPRSTADAAGAEPWDETLLAERLSAYHEDHELIRTDPRARGTQHTIIDRSGSPHFWHLEQILVDPEEHNDWVIKLDVDLPKSDEIDRPALIVRYIGP